MEFNAFKTAQSHQLIHTYLSLGYILTATLQIMLQVTLNYFSSQATYSCSPSGLGVSTLKYRWNVRYVKGISGFSYIQKCTWCVF